MSTLSNRVYALLKHVPPGRVTTYKALADALGTKAYRAIGQALRKNPYAPNVPCHRVIASDGTIAGFMGNASGPAIQKKIALLKQEGVAVKNKRVLHFRQILHPLHPLR